MLCLVLVSSNKLEDFLKEKVYKIQFGRFLLNLESFYYVSEHRQTHEEFFMIYLRIETCLTSVSRTYKTITLKKP